MDELVQHCLRELSFDGDLGCDITRLQEFIKDFYASGHAFPDAQSVDEGFCSYVWSLIVQRSEVQVGAVPKGSVAVYIAPKRSQAKKKKRNADEEEGEEDEDPDHFRTRLELIDEDEKLNSSLDQLKGKHGDKLRVAVDHDTSFVAITGSHIRPPKLSAAAYTSLQFITRGRLNGISMTDLSKVTGYDSKTCFYHARNLADLGHVVKIPSRKDRNILIHKYFYERNPIYRSIAAEEQKQGEGGASAADGSDDPLVAEGDVVPTEKPAFDPIDSRHLASDALIRGRLIQLLKNSKNGMHQAHNILSAIGFHNPTRKERRYFLRHLDQAVKDAVVEKVYVASVVKPGARTICLRLLPEGQQRKAPEGSSSMIPEDDNEGNEGDEPDEPESAPFVNLTFDRQLVSLLEEAGLKGTTSNELIRQSGHFDKRIIERRLTPARTDSLPPQLANLGCASILETFGRERRYRLYTVASYREFFASEGLVDESENYSNISLIHAGEHAQVDDSDFYDGTLEAWGSAVDNWKHGFGQPRKKKDQHAGPTHKNPVLPDGTVKNGRPPKSKSKAAKRVLIQDDEGADGAERPKRGRKRKADEIAAANEQEENRAGDEEQAAEAELADAPTHKRGRPRKKAKGDDQADKRVIPAETEVTEQETETSAPSAVTRTRKRQAKASKDSGVPPVSDIVSTPGPPLALNVLDGNAPGAVQAATTSISNQQDEVSERATVMPLHDADAAAEVSDLDIQDTPRQITLASRGLKRPISPTTPPPTKQKKARTSSSNQMSTEAQVAAHGARVSQGSASHQENNVPEHETTNFSTTSNMFLFKKEVKSNAQNLSNIRLQNEVIGALKASDGIAHHRQLMDYLRSNSQAIRPGAMIDGRTLGKSLKSLEGRGAIKMSQTLLRLPGSMQRSICIIRLPDVSQAALAEFISSLTTSLRPLPSQPAVRSLAEPMEYDRGTRPAPVPSKSHHPITAQDWRDEILSDHHTVAQLYGFLSGVFMRARELHLYVVNHILNGQPSTHFVSVPDRIVAMSYFLNDMSIGTYCAVVAKSSYDEGLETFLRDPENVAKRLSQIPPRLRELLELDRLAAPRNIFKLLQLLIFLGLITPLRRTTMSALFECPPNGTYPTTFDVQTDLAEIPQYWRFSDTAPIFNFAATRSDPPYIGQMAVSSLDDCLLYWTRVQEASKTPFTDVESIPGTDHPSFTGPPEFVRKIRRAGNWVSDYELSAKQRRYLESLIDPTTGTTPIEDDTPDRFDAACYVSTAPSSIVHQYLHYKGQNIKTIVRRMQRKSKKSLDEERGKAREVLAVKAAEVRDRLEDDWRAIVSRVQSGDLPSDNSSFRQLHDAFILSKGTLSLDVLEMAIRKALGEAEQEPNIPRYGAPVLAARQDRKARAPATTLPPTMSQQPRPFKLVEELLVEQRKQPAVVKRSKAKGKQADQEGQRRAGTRRRFFWTPEYDELARDAAAILRVRCRSQRMDWTAMDQIFTATDRNTVRQRIAKYDATAPGSAYLRRLEDAWQDVWIARRGTTELPDDNPDHPSDFDLPAHINYLRKHIDKRAIHTGGLAVEGGRKVATLPASLAEIERKYRVKEAEAKPRWEFVYTMPGDEPREKCLRGEALSLEDEGLLTYEQATEPVCFAESAIKMVLSTSEFNFQQEAAQRVISGMDDSDVRAAIQRLQQRNVIGNVEGKRKPGTHFRYQDWYEKEALGPLDGKIFHDAMNFEQELERDETEWKDWSLLAGDGQAAVIMKLISDRAVELDIDTSIPAMWSNRLVMGSGKKIDDDHIESSISIRLVQGPPQTASAAHLASPELSSVVLSKGPVAQSQEMNEHNSALQHAAIGSGVACRRNVKGGVVDCEACLWIAQSEALQRIEPNLHPTFFQIVQAVSDTGKTGLEISTLLAQMNASAQSIHSILATIRALHIPLLFSTGYTKNRLVSARFIKHWTVPVVPREQADTSDEIIETHKEAFAFPRRWLDIHGDTISSIWAAGLASVLGWITLRPGISEAALRAKLSGNYDRQEVNDLLRHLYRSGLLVYRDTNVQPIWLYEAGWSTEEEEKKLHWSVSNEGEAWFTLGSSSEVV